MNAYRSARDRRTRLAALAVLTALVAPLAIFLLAAPSQAAGPTPSISVDPASGPPGTSVTVEGNMFGPDTCDPDGDYVLFHGSSDVRVDVTARRNADGTFSYLGTVVVPGGTFAGAAPVEFRQDDCSVIGVAGTGTRGTGTRRINVAPAADFSARTDFTVTNRPPVASSFELETGFQESVSADLAPRVSDPDGDDGYAESFTVATPPAHGTAVLTGSRVRYTPEPGFSGSDTFRYRVCEVDSFEGAPACGEPATVSVIVGRPTPSISVDPASGPPRTSVTIEGDLFGPDSCAPSGNYVLFHGSSDVRAEVTARRNADGTFSYSTTVIVPKSTFTGPAPVEFRQDGCGVVGIAAVAPLGPSAETDFAVTNRPPEALPFELTTHFQEETSADLAANVFDPDGDDGYAESFTIATPPAHGTAALTGSRVTYTPADGFSGSDAFTYRVCERDDIEGPLSCGQPATVSVTVTPPVVVVSLATRPTVSCLGHQVAVVGHVTVDGVDAPASTVTFRMSMPAQPVLTFAAATNSAGRATVVYQRSATGADPVTASVVVPGADPATAGPVVVRWRSCEAEPVPPSDPPGNPPAVPPAIPQPPPDGPPPTNPPPANPPPVTGGNVPSERSLRATDTSPLPGSRNVAVGRGCLPQAPVALRLGTAAVGSARADAGGRFRIPFRVPSLPTGRHLLVAACGPVAVTTPIDLVVTSSTSGASGAAATTVGAVLMFFVLLGGQLVRPGLGGAGAVPTSL